MAQSKKRTKKKQPVKKAIPAKPDPAVIRRVIETMTSEPGVFDKLSRRHQDSILNASYSRPVFRIAKGNMVPRHYKNYLRDKIYYHLENVIISDMNETVTSDYMELLTYGIPVYRDVVKFSTREDDPARVNLSSDLEEMLSQLLDEIRVRLEYHLTGFSKINFRHYGFNIRFEMNPYKWIIELFSHPAEKEWLLRDGKRREAYACYWNKIDGRPFLQQTIPSTEIDPEMEAKELPVYIQSHALRRLKERLDVHRPKFKNYLLLYSVGIHQLVKGEPLIACVNPDMKTVGYLHYELHKGALYVLTFLPLTSWNTPEGKKMNKLLRLNNDEMTYLGMDKLSFLFEMDFERLPEVKDALIESGIWEVRQSLLNDPSRLIYDDPENSINEGKTKSVISFFEKRKLA